MTRFRNVFHKLLKHGYGMSHATTVKSSLKAFWYWRHLKAPDAVIPAKAGIH